ncbi:hypothetical protein LguiA_025128 [Lonicera macranthoides]
MASCVSIGTWMCSSNSIIIQTRTPSASLSLLPGASRTRRTSSLSLGVAKPPSPLLQCSFISSSSLSLSSSSSFSGLSLGLDFNTCNGTRTTKRHGLVVRAGKAALCLTKRNRSRKSLARTHGFRKRMRTTGGRAILKRRRAKGRKALCTKTNHNTGKRS